MLHNYVQNLNTTDSNSAISLKLLLFCVYHILTVIMSLRFCTETWIQKKIRKLHIENTTFSENKF